MDSDIETIGLLDDDEIELDHAALALSELDHEGIELEPYYALLDEIGERLDDFAEAETPEAQGEALAQVFHEEFGFTGDADSYDAPLNADLIRVLDRRRGLPVSLSLLYVAAARRLGWTAYATNTPGHVLVRIGDENGGEPPYLIDPFHGGAPVSDDRLAALLHGTIGPDGVPGPEHIAPMTNRTVLARLLLNQASRAERAGDPVRALAIYERITLVAPDNADGWWELARLQLQLRDVSAARASLSAMLEVTRDPQRRELITTTLQAIATG
ncbi:transglutaminase-like domain-containing protein [Novosphingobium sp. G106]|uniref:SirB1 family protein n=1 Tax=Novosphingobium sp. G106 TaxID=2849500 RepID=UPI001C2D44FD|nr:transglutaminase-like domain-containing protein [Novosphingobium sp. G106]MBV1690960.1 transglutaminase-like domain-containing protein [Novosphingobium sp. G106]